MVELNIINEIDKLEAVLVHEPGKEVENMSPTIAERALYSDILNLSIAKKEFSQFKGILESCTNVFEIKPLLKAALKHSKAIELLRGKMQMLLPLYEVDKIIESSTSDELAYKLICGIEYPRNTLVNFLQEERFMLNPLHNIFYTRDASFIFTKSVYKSQMAKKVRQLEPVIMELVFKYSGEFKCDVVDIENNESHNTSFEGGDIIAASKEVVIIGMGSRSTAKGIDKLIRTIACRTDLKHVIIQELPDTPESFIHLDMVFTIIDTDTCVIYEPLIMRSDKYKTIQIDVDEGEVTAIKSISNIIEGLKKLNIDLRPVYCGGGKELVQEREQWHSGANFFAIDQGKIIGYERNEQTSEELSKIGFEVIPASRFIQDKLRIEDFNKCLITISGSELARGGGGARCMTMPLNRRNK